MPLSVPNLSDLTYRDLLDEALARIPVHNPEWTNFNDSDPGVTLVQLFAFLTESLLYRGNQIPERMRRKFLSLQGIPLRTASPARGLVTITRAGGALMTPTLPSNQEVRAGSVPFRTDAGLDVLPVEWRVLYKHPVAAPAEQLVDVYQQLYVTYGRSAAPPNLALYETVPLTPSGPLTTPRGVNLAADTIDGSLWIALLKRSVDASQSLDDVRAAIGGKTISLGIVPALVDPRPVLSPGLPSGRRREALALLRFEVPAGGSLLEADDRQPRYLTLDARLGGDIFSEPSVVQLTLPPRDKLTLWDNLEPLDEGVGNLPPPLEDTDLADRLVTWVRLRLVAETEAAGQTELRLLWAGLNTVMATQRAHVAAEVLPGGTGEPDQVVTLARPPVIAGSVHLMVTPPGAGEPTRWAEIDDLLSADSEVTVIDPRLPPGAAETQPHNRASANVFQLDAESGRLTFGDGLRGRRPPFGAMLRADYDYSLGREGNVGVGAIDSGPTGFSVRNEVRTWGGADAETVDDGEKQISRYLQHRDRLVTAEDFETITRRTPGVEIGRVEVIPAFHPELAPNEAGDAPGAVTLMVIPRHDPLQPDAPRPDRLFLNTICAYLDPRRLVTTEVYLRGPNYKGIWISVGIRVEPGASVATVREAVEAELRRFLSPLPPPDRGNGTPDATGLTRVSTANRAEARGWPLGTAVIRLQLLAVTSRVSGVLLANDVLLAEDQATLPTTEQVVGMSGLELPRVLGISVVPGTPIPLNELRDQRLGALARPAGDGTVPRPPVALPLPVPALPEKC
jgi:Baseplate J-like protein